MGKEKSGNKVNLVESLNRINVSLFYYYERKSKYQVIHLVRNVGCFSKEK